MRYIFLTCLLCSSMLALCEGTRELAPNAEIIVNGRSTTDIAAIYIGNQSYGNFANFDQSETSTRLNVRILDPQTECLMLGFGPGRDPGNGSAQFRFYVKDPNGNVVYSSENITNGNNQIDSWQQAFNGPQALFGPGGYAQITISSAQLMQAGWIGQGDYFIEFEYSGFGFDPFYIPLWDISVVDCSANPMADKKGRVWSEQWALFSPPPRNQDSNFDRPFNGAFYIVAPDADDPGAAFITRMNFDGSRFRGAAFSVALNSFGSRNSGNLFQDRKSVLGENTIDGEYPVFLNDPIDLFTTAELGDLSILGSEGCLPDDFCFKAISTESGEIELLLDFDEGDGVYTPSSRDVLINVNIPVNQVGVEFCIPWDGKDGEGIDFMANDFDSIPVLSAFRQGIYHFPVYDVERNLTGFVLEAVRPAGVAPLLYYDDSNITFSSLTGSPNVNLTGCNTPCHTWDWDGDNYDPAYGNLNTINSWWYARTLLDEKNVAVKFNKSVNELVSFCEEDQIQIGDSIITTEGLHVFHFVSEAGCDSIVTVEATIVSLVTAIFSDFNILNCDHPIATLSGATTNPLNNLVYSWSIPDSQDIDRSASSIQINSPGNYGLTITESMLGCYAADDINIQQDFIHPQINIDNSPVLNCYLSNRTINTSPQDENLSYEINWSTLDGNIVDLGETFNPVVNLPGNYFISTTNLNNGCTSIDTALVLQDTATYLGIAGANQLTSDFCEVVSLNIATTSPFYDSISWTPSSVLSCADCESPTFIADREEEFRAVVTDTNGCKSIHLVSVDLTKDYKIYIPNAFSPNDDGVNDVFKLFSSPCEVDVMEFTLFDRWGSKMFERFDYKSTDDVGWDGVFRDKLSEPGLYIYHAIIRTWDDRRIPLQGDVHLVK